VFCIRFRISWKYNGERKLAYGGVARKWEVGSMKVPSRSFFLLALVIALGFIAVPGAARAANEPIPAAARDRGAGIPTSMFGTFVNQHQLLVFPFFEHVSDHNHEYNPALLGFGPNVDYRGKYHSSSGQLFIAYGVTDRLAVEFEMSRIRASLEKDVADNTATPPRIEESGLGDVGGQVRMRLADETAGRPEVFGFVEITAPSQKHKLLIGNPDWDFRPGIGMIRGFSWGTMTFRTTFEYNREVSALSEPAHLDIGETSVEYLRRLSPGLRLNVGLEGGEGGAPDEWELRSGLQARITNGVLLRLDNSVGLFSKAPDWTPAVGLMFSLPRH